MDAVSIAVGLALIATALVTTGLSVRIARDRTRRNRWCGVGLAGFDEVGKPRGTPSTGTAGRS